MAPPTTTSPSGGQSTTAAAAPTPRSRAQGSRKKTHAPADEAAYHAPSGGTGMKRQAADRPEGEPRVKRKRVDASASAVAGGSSAGMSGLNGARRDRAEGDGKISLIDFNSLPVEALHEYLVQFDLVPDVDPSPLSADDPPPPSALLRPRGHTRRHASTASPGPSLPITPANRPRREVGSRRRSARLVEDERGSEQSVTPILADVDEVKAVLAQVAQRHFREHTVKEVDTLASFMCAVKAKGVGEFLRVR